MKRAMTLTVLTILAGLLIISGCSKEDGTTASLEEGLNYEGEFGGYDASDEAPAFGNEAILEEMSDDSEEAVSEPELDPVFDSLDSEPDVRVYGMKILWGMLEFDSTVTQITDWSGSLTIERGAIRILEKIRFEKGDYLVRPRYDCNTIEWVSYTQPHFDGIFVFLYDVPDTAATTENTVTLTTGPYSRTFTMSELDSLSEIVEVDNIGNKISIEARYTPPLDCAAGFLDGKWVKKGRYHGVFFGRWVRYDGLALGHVKGHWGVNRDGDSVFFGKWINRLGQFKGFLRGTWIPDPATDAADPVMGTFEGIWADKNGNAEGPLGGEWMTVPHISVDNGNGNGNGYGNSDDCKGDDEIGCIPKRARGFFRGRWAEDCPDVVQ